MTNLSEEEKRSLQRFGKKFDVFLLAVFGIIALFFGISTNSSVDWFQKNGIRTTAQVVDAYTKNRQAVYIVQYKVSGQIVTTEVQGSLVVGQTVEILYRPDNHADVRVASIKKTGYVFYIATAIFWLCAAAGTAELSYTPPTE